VYIVTVISFTCHTFSSRFVEGCTIPGRRFTVSTRCCMVTSCICLSLVWNLLHDNLLTPEIFRWLLDFGRLVHPCVYKFVTIVTEFLKFLTPVLLMWRIWWAPNNTSKGQMGFNLVFEGLKNLICLSTNYSITGGYFIVNAYCKQSFQLHELAVWQTLLFKSFLVDILHLM